MENKMNDKIDEEFEKLRKRISEFVANESKESKCWWDRQECPFSSFKIAGFENAGSVCGNCYKLPRSRVIDTFEEVFGEYLEKERNAAFEEGKEDGKKEGREKAYETICEKISGKIDEVLEDLIFRP